MNTVTRPRVFRRLLRETSVGPRLRPRVLSKGTLTELSHVLENAVIDHDLPGAVFTGFQRSANWLRALDRYQRLVVPRARSVAVFATGNIASMGDDAIVKVQLGEDSPLTEEWFLIVLTTGFSAVLLGEETGEPFTSEPERRFDTVWSFDPEVVTQVAHFVRDEVIRFDAATADRIEEALLAFPPGPGAEHLRDEVLGDIVVALEASRQRLLGIAEMEQRAADELRDLDRTKNAFLSAVSHELRTPLTVVHGMAMTLRRLGSSLSDGERARVEGALVSQTDRLSTLLDDLLDVDRMTRGVLRLRQAEGDVVATVRQTLTDLDVDERITLLAPGPLTLTADHGQVERIVANLVENAIKYAPDGAIVVEVTPRAAGGATIRVRDEGPGIPEHELRRVFEPFYRVDDDHPQPGTGIGLSLVAEFARLHGGRAYADPQAERGACMIVELPSGVVSE